MPATPTWPPRSAPRLFIDDALFPTATVTISGSQAHYLIKVMRARLNDPVVLCDNVTGEWAMRVASVGKRSVELTAEAHLSPRENVPDFWLCAALLKKDRFDLVLEKATELGVARIQPVITRRCVADKLNMERARTITIEAAEQCARTALPELAPPVTLNHLLREWPADRRLFFADEQGGDSAAGEFARHVSPATLLTGPEGEFDDTERRAIRDLPQSVPISLGPRILRGETAAIAAISVWMAQSGDW